MTITRETIIHAAELIGAALVIWGMIKMIVQPLLRFNKQIEELVKHSGENYLNILRLTFVATEMPIEERLSAGEKYVAAGGNGAVKAQYEALKKIYEKELTK
ncbi:MAG: hypothetical protein IK080_03030 [Clostridia bacterium]|nr:hypothetical protein [Clostridia bacterium]